MAAEPVESDLEGRLGRAIGAWMDGVRTHAVATTVACLLSGALAAVYAAGHLGIHSDIHSLVAEDVPFMELRRSFERSFPLVDDMILAVVDAQTPEAATRAADGLAARLEQETDAFHAVFVPGGGPFFERNALLYLDSDALENLADRLAQAQPFLAEVERDPSLRSVFRLLTRALEPLSNGEAAGLGPIPLFERMADGLEALNAGRPPSDAWREMLVGEWGQNEQKRQVILLAPKLDLDSFQPAARAVERVRQVVAESGLERDGVRVRLTGDFVLTYEENQVLVGQAAVVGVASFLLVAGLLAIAMRSVWLIAASLVTLLTGLAASLALAAAVVGFLNPVSVAFPVLFIGLSADFGIHLCLRYRELRAVGAPHADALAETGRGVGSSVLLCAVTTAIGFIAFVPTEFVGLAQLGWIAGPGILLGLFFSLTLLPALLCIAPERVRAAWAVPLPPVAAFSLPVRHARPVRWVALAVGLGSLALLPGARFDPNQLHVRDPNTESVKALEDLLVRARTSPWTVSALASDAAEAAALRARLRELDVVGRVVTPADLVPSDQAQKLEVIADIAGFMAPPSEPRPPPTLHAQLAALHEFQAHAEGLGERCDPELAADIRRLAAAAGALRVRIERADDPRAALDEVEDHLVDPVRWWVTRLRSALEAQPVDLGDLPAAVREQMIGTDGRHRVEVFPRYDVNDPVELGHFVDAVREVAPDVAGQALYLVEFGRSMVRSLQQALFGATVAIGLLLFALWRRLDDTFVVLIILALAAVTTAATALLVGVPFNFADVIALPLLLGLGVDSSIHLVHRFRGEVGGHGELLRTSTARAVSYSGLTTLASFGTLAFAPHRGMATIGQLLSIGVLLMLVCNLVVLPALLERRSEGSAGRPTPA